VVVITFGAPRCGNAAYIARVVQLVGRVTRVVHDSDVVPSTPALFMSYAHCGGEWLHLQPRPQPSPTADALRSSAPVLLAGYERWLAGADVWWREVQMLWRRLCQREFGVADHYIERYLEALGVEDDGDCDEETRQV
jgi:hypothetical protein